MTATISICVQRQAAVRSRFSFRVAPPSSHNPTHPSSFPQISIETDRAHRCGFHPETLIPRFSLHAESPLPAPTRSRSRDRTRSRTVRPASIRGRSLSPAWSGDNNSSPAEHGISKSGLRRPVFFHSDSILNSLLQTSSQPRGTTPAECMMCRTCCFPGVGGPESN